MTWALSGESWVVWFNMRKGWMSMSKTIIGQTCKQYAEKFKFGHMGIAKVLKVFNVGWKIRDEL